MSEAKERPILMCGEMVIQTLADNKTKTRRVVRPQPFHAEVSTGGDALNDEGKIYRCPYGAKGDRLWVRETWQACQNCNYTNYAATVNRPRNCTACDETLCAWKPSIHMFRSRSRITLEIVSVRVERVQDISDEDAIAEGILKRGGRGEGSVGYRDYNCEDSAFNAYGFCEPANSFRTLWDSINAKRGFGWATNPYVWVVEFKRL